MIFSSLILVCASLKMNFCFTVVGSKAYVGYMMYKTIGEVLPKSYSSDVRYDLQSTYFSVTVKMTVF